MVGGHLGIAGHLEFGPLSGALHTSNALTLKVDAAVSLRLANDA